MFVYRRLLERAKTQSVDIVSTKYTPQICTPEHSALAEKFSRIQGK
jgi:hypothetical protein